MHKKGISLNSVEKSLSHSADKIRRRTLLCFEKILVSKSFQQRKGEASRFCRNFLSHRTETKSFVKEPSCFPEIFWYRKKFMHKRGLITILSKFLCLTVPKIFVRESPTVFEKNSIKKKVLWMKRGVSRFSLENFLSHSAEKLRIGTLQCFTNFEYQKLLRINRKMVIC